MIKPPEANWEHPVSYYCVDASGNYEQQDASSPATGFPRLCRGRRSECRRELWQPDDPYVWTPTCINDCTNNYALLIDGGKDPNSNYVRYWNDIAFMYINLNEYDYPPNQVTVLKSDGSSRDSIGVSQGHQHALRMTIPRVTLLVTGRTRLSLMPRNKRSLILFTP